MLQTTSHQILNYVNCVPSSLQFCLWLHILICNLSQIHTQYEVSRPQCPGKDRIQAAEELIITTRARGDIQHPSENLSVTTGRLFTMQFLCNAPCLTAKLQWGISAFCTQAVLARFRGVQPKGYRKTFLFSHARASEKEY